MLTPLVPRRRRSRPPSSFCCSGTPTASCHTWRFVKNLQHGDATVRQAQDCLGNHCSHSNAVEALEKQSGLLAHTFKCLTNLRPAEYRKKFRLPAPAQV